MAGKAVYGFVGVLAAVFVVTVACGGDEKKQEATPVAQLKPHEMAEPPPLVIDPSKTYTATIELEKGGEIVIALSADKATRTVNNFVFLSRQGFYDGVTFHRVITGFMAQAGDPTASGGQPVGYTFDNEFHPDLRHDGPGTLSMANAGIRNGRATNGSQFFITYTETGHLDGLRPDGSPKDCTRESCHSVFGKVVSGMDVLSAITPRDPSKDRFKGDVIKAIKITVGP